MASLERLMAVIDAYGGEPERWPAGERDGLLALAAGQPEAATRLQEALALDRVLAFAPAAAEDKLAGLHQRIMVAAEDSRGTARSAVEQGGEVVDMARRPQRRRLDVRRTWPAAAALAASLILGIFIGTSETGGPAVEGLVETAGIDVSTDSAFDLLGTSSEELL